MDQSHQYLTILFLFSLAILFFPQADTVSTIGNNNTGFSLELIHRDSVDSPLYPGNLTSVERLQRDIMLSESRSLWLEEYQPSTTVGRPQDLNIRPILTHVGSMYTVKVGIGWNPSTVSHLLLDTGSGLVWTQSEPCNTCFEHDGPRYRPSLSHSFRRLHNRHAICRQPPFRKSPDGQCTYKTTYDQGRLYTRGALGLERFSFESKNDPTRKTVIDHVIFGTSYNNSKNMFRNRNVVGILGMDMAEHSFVMQTASGRFSYCLFPGHGVNSHLRFGTDIVIQGSTYQRTRFLRDHHSFHYQLPLVGISVNGQAVLRLPPNTFERCTIDSGAPATFVVQSAYDAIEESLVEYFRRRKVRRSDGWHKLRLCYRMPEEGLDSFPFPSVEFHFDGGAALRLERIQLFYVVEEEREFCLFMIPSPVRTLIGAHAQRNTHFVYDVSGRQLHFARKNSCG